MNQFETAVAGRLAKWIAEREAVTTEQLKGGFASDFSDYRNRCGYLRALTEVRERMREIESDLNKGE